MGRPRAFEETAVLDAAAAEFRLRGFAETSTEQLCEAAGVRRSGSTCAPLVDADVFPKTKAGRLRTWIGVGGTPESVVRTARYGLPLMIAIIGGAPGRFTFHIDLYRRAAEKFGTTAHPVGVHPPGFIADTDEEARNVHWPHYKVIRDRVGAQRGWPPISRQEYEYEVERGSLYVGSPETVARKMAAAIKLLGAGRFDLIYTTGAQPLGARLRAVELYGTKVLPLVREILAD